MAAQPASPSTSQPGASAQQPARAPSPPSPDPSASFSHQSFPSQIKLQVHQPAYLTEHGELDVDTDDEDGTGDEAGDAHAGGHTFDAERRRDDFRVDSLTSHHRDRPQSDRRRAYSGDSDGAGWDHEELSSGGEEDSLLRTRRIVVKKDWDDSDDEEDEDEARDDVDVDANGHQSDGAYDDSAAELRSFRGSQRRNRRQRRPRQPDSYMRTLRPSLQSRRTWWRYLTNPAQPNSLSIPHVTINLFAASLHPSVLLSTPFYFSRTGIALGMTGVAVVAVLGGVGGGLWVVLSRYVGGKKTVEAITGASFGRHSKHKARIGKLLAGSMLAAYSTGSAFLAYFALADLLLQLFFHYSPRGIPLHDRGFVTLVVGAVFTVPLIVVPLAKRTLIRLAAGTALILYPIIAAILFAKVYTWDPNEVPRPDPSPDANLSFAASGHSANPLHPPSIWAPYSLLPLLTLSSSPLQILAHNRSLRRNPSARTQGAQRGSNVKAFLACQASQVALVIGTIAAFGVGIGTKGIQDRLEWPIHPNLFTSLPHDDDLINLARLFFVFLLSTHLALCLAVGRSSWARLLKLLNLNPFKWSRARAKATIRLEGPEGEAPRNVPDPENGGTNGTAPTAGGRGDRRRHWGKLARTSVGGAMLWGLVAFLAYFSGVGGIRRKEKEGEEARFVRASEVLGLFGGGVGFVLPGAVWVLLFWVRRQRDILGDSMGSVGGGVAAAGWVNWVKGPLGVLARRSSAVFGGTASSAAAAAASTVPVPTRHSDPTPAQNGLNVRAGQSGAPPQAAEGASSLAEGDATRILLARKERQLQRRTKERRLWQDVLVLAAVLPCGLALLVLGAIELSRGGY
ncbi:unnamed protein product [Parajaminaea phylloscopi]